MILSIFFFLGISGKILWVLFSCTSVCNKVFFSTMFSKFFLFFFFLGMRLQAPSYSQNTSCDRKPYFGHYGTNAMNSALHHAPYYTEKCVMWLRWSNEEFAQKKNLVSLHWKVEIFDLNQKNWYLYDAGVNWTVRVSNLMLYVKFW